MEILGTRNLLCRKFGTFWTRNLHSPSEYWNFLLCLYFFTPRVLRS